VDIVFVFSPHVDMSLDGVEIIANDRSVLTLCLVSVLMWTCLWMVSRSLLMEVAVIMNYARLMYVLIF